NGDSCNSKRFHLEEQLKSDCSIHITCPPKHLELAFTSLGFIGKKLQSVGVLDRISSLPDHILCRILSLLPIKDVVRTSKISLRWRYLYAFSVSIIDFNDCLPHISLPSENDIIDFNDCLPQFPVPSENDNNFLDFVDRFFSVNKHLSLECFRVNDYWVTMDDIQPYEGFLHLNGWICSALWCGVKEIDIRFIYEDVSTLSTLLFSCQSLVTSKLNIRVRGNMKVPSNTCLPNLKTLHFSFSKFQDGYPVIRLISNCHVLENLEFIYCEFCNIRELNIHNLSLKRLVLDFGDLYIQSHRGFNFIEIDTPNLVYFKYVDAMVEGYTLSDMKSLERADIDITLLASVDYERATYLLKRICNVQSI
ncbi:putative F-box protein At1g58310, partial [Hibiscus syriacus]|uniref:putative F-box protein At1g58310 n=1 Tax=Hibiscus syriacus TaxID=106335 RepID=UPI001922C304